MIREEAFTYPSKDGKTTIHGVRWYDPEQPVRAVVQISHGMCEYIERYRGFAEYLAARGILVTGHDHLGHGQSVTGPENYGYFAEKNGNVIVLRDIHEEYRITKALYPEVPYILFGHSMGSFLARQYLCCYGTELSGAIICGTGGQPRAAATAGMALASSVAAAHGWRYRSKILAYMTSGSYNALFKPNRTAFDWLSVNEENVDAYVADTRCGFVFTANGYYNMFKGMAKIQNPQYLKMMPMDLPVYFIAGTDDPVGECGKGVTRVYESFRKLGMQKVMLKLYPGMRHEILNETDREQVYEDVYHWVEAVIR